MRLLKLRGPHRCRRLPSKAVMPLVQSAWLPAIFPLRAAKAQHRGRLVLRLVSTDSHLRRRSQCALNAGYWPLLAFASRPPGVMHPRGGSEAAPGWLSPSIFIQTLFVISPIVGEAFPQGGCGCQSSSGSYCWPRAWVCSLSRAPKQARPARSG